MKLFSSASVSSANLQLIGLIAFSVVCFAPMELRAADESRTAQTRPDTSNTTVIGPASPGPRCEWIESTEYRRTPACGFDKFSLPKFGVYRCGPVSNGTKCEPKCFFKECSKDL